MGLCGVELGAIMYHRMKTVGLVAVVVLLFCAAVSAQTDSTSNPSSSSLEVGVEPVVQPNYGLPWELDRLPEIRKQVADMDLSDQDTKTKLLDIYDKAVAQWQQQSQLAEKTFEYSTRTKNVPTDLSKITEQIRQLAEEVYPANVADMALAEVERKVSAAQTALEETKRNSVTHEGEPKRRAERKIKIPEEMAGVREQLNQLQEKLPPAPAEAAISDIAFAERVLQVVQIVGQKSKIENLSGELTFYDAAGDLLTARRDLASRQVVQGEKRLTFWQEQLALAQKREAERLKAQAQETVAQSQHADPIIQKMAKENADLVTAQADVIKQMEQTNQYANTIEGLLAEQEAGFADLKKQIEAAGEVTNVMGVLLLSKRNDLPDVRRNRERIRARLPKISTARLNWGKHDKQWSRLADVEGAVTLALSEEGLILQDLHFEEVRREASRLIEDRRSILRSISDHYEKYARTLASLDIRERKLVATVSQFAVFIDENILWVRSSEPFGVSDFHALRPALRWFVNPDQWLGLWRHLWKDLRSHGVGYLLSGVFLLMLYLNRWHCLRRLTVLAQQCGHTYSDKFTNTLKALMISLLLVLPLPLGIGLVSWRVMSAPQAMVYLQILGRSLRGIAVLIALMLMLIRVCRRNGPADHLRLPRDSMDALAVFLQALIFILVPLVFLRRTFCDSSQEEVFQFSLGRMVFVLELLAVACFFMLCFRPSGPVMKPILMTRKAGLLDRQRFLWYGVLVILPLVLVCLSLLGYGYTAQQIYHKFLACLGLIVAVLFFNGMLTRLVTLTQARWVLREKHRKKEVQDRQAGSLKLPSDASKGSTPSRAVEVAQEQLVIEISQQSRSLIRALCVVIVMVGFWVIWEDVLPALHALDNIEVWKVTDAQGIQGSTSLSDVMKAIVIFVMAVIGARNGPGLMHMLILRRLPLDQALKFAVTSITRYVLVVIGVVLTFSQLGIGWAKVQWLIAAMTVGLGFGLQEIFANFVSGLIILFEQPIRIGDAVTVGDVNGEVTKIKIRATTIRKWDQKELIVPNKEFITGRLLNWSLSDKTLRMEFPVGVAYGSDIKKTEETLFKVARSQKGVIHDDPAPRVLFRSFGESSLDFELRVYIPNMENYLDIWHEINCAIDTEFREAGIEIAFPQRDLHIRSVEAPFQMRTES